MLNKKLENSRSLIQLDDKKDQAYVTSLQIAEKFSREHKVILLAIRNLSCSKKFNRNNFMPISYIDSRNRIMDCYKLTRDGFSLLVMGFTGDKAMIWKEKYIQAFNKMEEYIIKQGLKAAELRGRSKFVRVKATDCYKRHGASKWYHYLNNTNAVYQAVLNKSARQIRIERNLDKKANVRDYLNEKELEKVISLENHITYQLDILEIRNFQEQYAVVKYLSNQYKQITEHCRNEFVGLMN